MEKTMTRYRPFAQLFVMMLAAACVAEAQERRLEYSFKEGQTMKYKRSYRSSEQAGFLPDGRRDTAFDYYYSVTIEAVGPDGTAQARLMVDSVTTRTERQWVTADGSDELRGLAVRTRMSSGGRMLEFRPPGEIGSSAYQLLEQLMNDIQNEGILPEMELEAGNKWRNELVLYIEVPDGEIKARSPVVSQYVRSETYRGVPCARIEYQGDVSSTGAQRGKVGTVTGMMLVSPEQGKKLREVTDIEATLLVNTPRGKVQLRVRQTYSLDLLN
jgi:hypothetical protein